MPVPWWQWFGGMIEGDRLHRWPGIGATFDRTISRVAKGTPMGKSFYLTPSYSKLRNASQMFSDLINAGAVSYGLTMPHAAAYKALNDSYFAKFLLADAPETRTKATILDRNNAAILLKANASMLAKIVEATTTVTDGQKANLGLSVRAMPAPGPHRARAATSRRSCSRMGRCRSPGRRIIRPGCRA